MAKLFNLKEWLTMPEAARHLTAMLKEKDEIGEADVLQLALDGRIKLSIRLVNNTLAQPGKIVGINDITFEEAQQNAVGGIDELAFLTSVPVDRDRLFLPEAQGALVSGVWDLVMVGNGRLSVENKYHALTGGPSIS